MRQAIPRAICQHADGGRVTAFSSRSKVTALRQFHLPSCVCVCVRASRDRRAGEERAGPGGALPTNGPMSGRSAVPGTEWRRRKSACLLAAAGVASVAGTAAGLRAPGVALAASLLVSGLIQSHGDTTCCKLPLSLSLLLAHEHSSTNTRT